MTEFDVAFTKMTVVSLGNYSRHVSRAKESDAAQTESSDTRNC